MEVIFVIESGTKNLYPLVHKWRLSLSLKVGQKFVSSCAPAWITTAFLEMKQFCSFCFHQGKKSKLVIISHFYARFSFFYLKSSSVQWRTTPCQNIYKTCREHDRASFEIYYKLGLLLLLLYWSLERTPWKMRTPLKQAPDRVLMALRVIWV